MNTTGDVQISITDGGGSAVVVPASSVQVKIGCATSGTDSPPQIIATRSLKTLQDTYGSGPLMEAAGLAVLTGATVLCVKVPTVTAGYVLGSTNPTKAITGATTASPTVITATAHGLATGDVVTIAGVGGNTGANGTFVVTVLTADTFSIPVDTSAGGAYTSGGTVQFDGVIFTGTGTSVVTATGAATDRVFCEVTITKGGTIAAAGITFTVSLDAGRTHGPSIALGTATTYLIPGTGITLHFAAGTLVLGDLIRFSTVAPLWDDAGIAAAFDTLEASGYATTGWGAGTHIVGYSTGSDASTFQTVDLDPAAVGYVFTRAIVEARDASPPAAWGGTGETEATWMAAIGSDFNVDAKRVSAAGGEYNMPSAFTNSVAGAPRYRRPLAWAYAARQAAIAPQRHAGRVRQTEGGPLSQIVLDATNDPSDGFVYHDERINPGLDPLIPGGAYRFTSARTRIGLPGMYIVNPITLAAAGSDYVLMPRGRVMDLACFIAHAEGQQDINDDVRVNIGKGPSDPIYGTIDERDARVIERRIYGALSDQMIAPGMITAATVTVDRTTNILSTSKVSVTIRITGKGYILEEDIDIGFANANAAA